MALSAAAFALAACGARIAGIAPPADIPGGWTAPVPPAAEIWPSPDWWRGFGSPELDALVAAARAGNFDLGAAAARVLQADAQVRVAGASLLPSLQMGADVTRQRTSSQRSTSTRTTGGSADVTLYDASLSASYELDFWARNRAGQAAAVISARASRYDQEAVALTVTAGVATTYFQILSLRDRLSVAHENLVNAERVLEVVLARARSGAASPLDVAQQRATVAAQRATIPALRQQERQAVNALAILLGRTPGAFDVTGTTLAGVALPAMAAGVPSGLLVRRPDIRNAEAQLAAANADIAAARAALLPSLQLTGAAGAGATALSSLFDSSSRVYSLAAALTQPIFEGGRLKGQVDLAIGRREELIQGYRKAIVSAFADVETALVAVERTAEQQGFLDQEVGQAQLAFQLAEARYRAGAVDLLTMLEAQRTLFQAQDNLAQARLAHLNAAASLFKALGGGWEDKTGAGPGSEPEAGR
ncbi:MAG: efflux transporter outer membrane subunit [Proteobacteria bacterium]|nr:efflux transporter outer membrane subunit [Pseudomonadota bacterium]